MGKVINITEEIQRREKDLQIRFDRMGTNGKRYILGAMTGALVAKLQGDMFNENLQGRYDKLCSCMMELYGKDAMIEIMEDVFEDIRRKDGK